MPYLNVFGEVADLLVGLGGVGQVVVHPPQQDLLGRQLPEVVDRLPVHEQAHQARVVLEVYVA